MNTNVSFRDVDEAKFRHFKSIVVREGMKTSDALNKAFDLFIAKFGVKQKKSYNLTSLEPEDWGPGSEKSSSEIDKVVYG